MLTNCEYLLVSGTFLSAKIKADEISSSSFNFNFPFPFFLFNSVFHFCWIGGEVMSKAACGSGDGGGRGCGGEWWKKKEEP